MNNVQQGYDFVQSGRWPATGKAFHVRVPIAQERIGRWEARFARVWMMVWGGRIGYDERATIQGRGLVEFVHPPRAWTLHAPGSAFHERLLKAERERECIWVIFEARRSLPSIEQRAFTLIEDPEGAMAHAARAMAALQDGGTPGSALAALGHLQVVLGLVLSAASAAPGDERGPWRVPESKPAAGGLLARVDAIIEGSLTAPPSRARLARMLGVSESAFSHRFRAETGMSLAQRSRWLRVRAAKARLAEPGATVKEVARELGFSSAFWFSRVFTEVAGMPPSDYQGRCRG